MSALFAKFPAAPEFWAAAAVIGFFFVTVQLAFAVPWLMAHMLFWGKQREDKGFLEIADRLAGAGMRNVSVLILLAAGVLIAAAANSAEELFTSVILLFPVLAAGFAFFLLYVLLIFASGGEGEAKKRWKGYRFLIAVMAGLCAVVVSGSFAAVSLVAERPALWPAFDENVLSVIFDYDWMARLASLWLSSLVSGGVLLMILGRSGFRWAGGGSVSSAIRVIRHGAFFALCPFLLLMVLSPWLIQGWFEMSLWTADEKWPLIFILISGAGGLVLIEVLFSVIQRRGDTSRAVMIAAGVFLGALLFFAAARLAVSGGAPETVVSSFAPKRAVPPRARDLDIVHPFGERFFS